MLDGSNAIAAGEWFLEDGLPLPEELSWDPSQDLCIRRNIGFDASIAHTHIGVAAEDLMIGIEWDSSGSTRRGAAAPVQLDRHEQQLELVVSGRHLGGTANIRTVVFTGAAARANDVGLPNSAGLVVWEEAKQVALEGTTPRFSVRAESFAVLGKPVDALWEISIAGLGSASVDPTLPAAELVQLLVNSDHPASRLLENSESSDERDQLVTFQKWEIARKLLASALENEVDLQREFGPGSLGEQLQAVVYRYMGEGGLARLKKLTAHQPEMVDMIIQAAHPSTIGS